MIVVYTAIFGTCDSLKKAPSGASDCVCFVEDPSRFLNARGWRLVQHDAPNPRRTAWHLRCVPHALFPDARKTIWIDASFTLLDLEGLLLDAAGHDICTFQHNSRSTVYAEGSHIAEIGQAPEAVVWEQLRHYANDGFDSTRLSTAGLMVRANTPQVRQFNEFWEGEINRYAGDNTQLSLDYAAWKTGLHIHHLTGTYKNNPYAHHNYKDHLHQRQPYDTDTTVRRDRRE